MITRDFSSESFDDDILELRGPEPNSYSFFNENGWLDKPFSEMLFVLLDSWVSDDRTLCNYLPEDHSFDEDDLFNDIISNAKELTYEQVVQFAAYSQFLMEHGNGIDREQFQEWMRVVFNLSANTDIRIPNMSNIFQVISDFKPHMTDILNYLTNLENDQIAGFSSVQLKEEIFKAHLLLTKPSWRELVDEAEKHHYFRGQINFLFSFSGISGSPARDYGSKELQDQFKDYMNKAFLMFSDNGLDSLNRPGDFLWERALLTQGDYMLSNGLNHSFLTNERESPLSWKRLLRDVNDDTASQCKFLKDLWDKISVTEGITKQLERLIDNASCEDQWRSLIIRTPGAIRYCKNKIIRRAENDIIYLLTKNQMNGWHAELFTYCLYTNFIKATGFQMLGNFLYSASNNSDDEPTIQLKFNIGDHPQTISIEFSNNEYRLHYRAVESTTSQLEELLVGLGFNKVNDWFHKSCSEEEIENFIHDLDQKLAE